jgi:hypothetical protein
LIAPRLKQSTFSRNLGIHLRNGFYANVIFDRVVGSLKIDKLKLLNLTVRDENDLESLNPQKPITLIKK